MTDTPSSVHPLPKGDHRVLILIIGAIVFAVLLCIYPFGNANPPQIATLQVTAVDVPEINSIALKLDLSGADGHALDAMDVHLTFGHGIVFSPSRRSTTIHFKPLAVNQHQKALVPIVVTEDSQPPWRIKACFSAKDTAATCRIILIVFGDPNPPDVQKA